MTEPKDDLKRYLQVVREAFLWKLEGLGEYDVRRPLTPTATNLLGLAKHLACVQAGYLGDCFGRPFPEPTPWFDDDSDPTADMWATADESVEAITGLYARASAHADATIDALPLDAIGSVPWWPEDRREITLHRILIHVIAEVNRHAGHADILRELLDGAAGLRREVTNLATEDEAERKAYFDRVEQAARQAADR
jgi:uncharacterized damage-inducible protein DinB